MVRSCHRRTDGYWKAHREREPYVPQDVPKNRSPSWPTPTPSRSTCVRECIRTHPKMHLPTQNPASRNGQARLADSAHPSAGAPLASTLEIEMPPLNCENDVRAEHSPVSVMTCTGLRNIPPGRISTRETEPSSYRSNTCCNHRSVSGADIAVITVRHRDDRALLPHAAYAGMVHKTHPVLAPPTCGLRHQCRRTSRSPRNRYLLRTRNLPPSR